MKPEQMSMFSASSSWPRLAVFQEMLSLLLGKPWGRRHEPRALPIRWLQVVSWNLSILMPCLRAVLRPGCL